MILFTEKNSWLIELYKAFRVDHGIFSFQNYNIMVFEALHQARWFESYLSNGQQYVKFNSFGLESAQIKCGVPQGSLLNTMIFLHLMFYMSVRGFYSFCC